MEHFRSKSWAGQAREVNTYVTGTFPAPQCQIHSASNFMHSESARWLLLAPSLFVNPSDSASLQAVTVGDHLHEY